MRELRTRALAATDITTVYQQQHSLEDESGERRLHFRVGLVARAQRLRLLVLFTHAIRGEAERAAQQHTTALMARANRRIEACTTTSRSAWHEKTNDHSHANDKRGTNRGNAGEHRRHVVLQLGSQRRWRLLFTTQPDSMKQHKPCPEAKRETT